MAYLEIRKQGELISRRAIADEQAHKGCKIRLGGQRRMQLRLGESKEVGQYQLTLFAF